MARGEKKLVRADALSGDAATKARQAEAADWQPTPEAKRQANTYRVIAWAAWVLAIGAEAFAIFWLLRQVPFEDSHLIGLVAVAVVVAGLAITGSVLWKRANHADPASTAQPIRFFIQNQLGVLMTLLAFVPLIVMILLNKNMDGKQKAIAGGVAAVLAVAALFFAPDLAPVSKEAVVAQGNQVVQLTGKDEVYWVKGGSVYHLCKEVPDVNRESKDGNIFTGTVAQAMAAGKTRLTKEVDQELKICGFAPLGNMPTPTRALTAAPASANASAAPSASPKK